ncbi:TetR family transcriptional regulator [Frigidibacter albus]|uniref:TetR family transcriptional regulator n=1 Tax=Frigidibacter albus TaxID=1465486 RepID=A0A6L8VGX0_9RHOB|nr:TetR/AcrR family transcriptional regulator [Frigidibacter albus]MZQ89384.1 TetR family transcriptional regulator [Frigidibacter albus]NBE31290.1 TetR family transcriptional regulator [Frigidibacter albus]GGH53899.1 TetR family transcriptional regulator [Frigidibacter albus]
MNDRDRQDRHATIARAAYALLAEHGYAGTSMLRIATAAKASNETLYRWYGNKEGLFRAMVEDNAAETRALLLRALERQDDPRGTLASVAAVFLEMLLGDRAILLNRAAAADPSGELGAAISAGGRDQVMPLLAELMGRICTGGDIGPAEATRLFISLLVGDLQIRRIIHNCPAPSQAEIDAQCTRSMALFYRLMDG